MIDNTMTDYYITEKELMKRLNCCRDTARKVGIAANSRVRLTGGYGVRYNWNKIMSYLEGTEDGR